jgi:hypothetical protein
LGIARLAAEGGLAATALLAVTVTLYGAPLGNPEIVHVWSLTPTFAVHVLACEPGVTGVAVAV